MHDKPNDQTEATLVREGNATPTLSSSAKSLSVKSEEKLATFRKQISLAIAEGRDGFEHAKELLPGIIEIKKSVALAVADDVLTWLSEEQEKWRHISSRLRHGRDLNESSSSLAPEGLLTRGKPTGKKRKRADEEEGSSRLELEEMKRSKTTGATGEEEQT